MSCAVLRGLTGVAAPLAFHVMVIVAPEAVAVTGEPDAFSAVARAAATSFGPLFMGNPVQAGLVLGPKQAVAVKPPTVSETVPESGTSSCAAVFTSWLNQPVLFL